jgi:PEP-utilizing family enzyme
MLLQEKWYDSIGKGFPGEHGGDPASIAFCHETGLDYVSCSAFRVPVARLAAAQAAIRANRGSAVASSGAIEPTSGYQLAMTL